MLCDDESEGEKAPYMRLGNLSQWMESPENKAKLKDNYLEMQFHVKEKH